MHNSRVKGFPGRGHVNAKALRSERSQKEQQRDQCDWREEIKGQMLERSSPGGGRGMGTWCVLPGQGKELGFLFLFFFRSWDLSKRNGDL